MQPLFGISFLLFCTFFFSASIGAQKTDSPSLIREFIQITGSYKQTPLYVELQMKNETNFIISEKDTAHLEGKFYLLRNSAYILLGGMEQLFSDSLMVVVSNKMQRIIVNTDVPSLPNTMQITSVQMKDSSIMALAEKYKAIARTASEGTIIELVSRAVLNRTSLPEETVELVYDTKTKHPLQIASKTRMLIPLEEEEYKKLSNEAEFAKMLLAIEGKSFFLIKEQISSVIYHKVVHDQNMRIPVAISDRIIKNKDGEFEPVKAYEGFEISIN